MRRKRLKWFFFVLAVALVALVAAARHMHRMSEIDALCVALAGPDAHVSAAAAAKLAAVDDPAGIRRVARYAGSSNHDVSQRVIHVLAGMGPRAIGPIRSTARSADVLAPSARWNMPVLRQLRNAWFSLPRDTDADFWASRTPAALSEALAEMGRPAKGELLKMMAGGDPLMRNVALYAFAFMDDPRNLDLLLSLLTAPPPGSHAAVQGLRKLESTYSPGPRGQYAADSAGWQAYEERRSEIVQALITWRGSARDRFKRDHLYALGEFEDNAMAMDILATTARDTYESLDARAAAARCLMWSGDTKNLHIAVAELADRNLCHDTVPGMQQDNRLTAAVAPLLDSTDSLVHQGAVNFFLETRYPDDLRFIADSCPAFSPGGRQAAIDTLTQRTADAPSLRRAALDALARIESAPPTGDIPISLDSSAPR